MTRFEILALLWPAFTAASVVGFAFFLGWLDDRRETRQARHPAE